MRILLVLLPLLGCQATTSNAPAGQRPPTQLVPGSSADRLRNLQREIGAAELLIDVLELCSKAIDAAERDEQSEIVQVCTDERLRRRNAAAGSSR